MSFIRKKIQIISYELKDKCGKNKESKDTEKGIGSWIEGKILQDYSKRFLSQVPEDVKKRGKGGQEIVKESLWDERNWKFFYPYKDTG